MSPPTAIYNGASGESAAKPAAPRADKLVAVVASLDTSDVRASVVPPAAMAIPTKVPVPCGKAFATLTTADATESSPDAILPKSLTAEVIPFLNSSEANIVFNLMAMSFIGPSVLLNASTKPTFKAFIACWNEPLVVASSSAETSRMKPLD